MRLPKAATSPLGWGIQVRKARRMPRRFRRPRTARRTCGSMARVCLLSAPLRKRLPRGRLRESLRIRPRSPTIPGLSALVSLLAEGGQESPFGDFEAEMLHSPRADAHDVRSLAEVRGHDSLPIARRRPRAGAGALRLAGHRRDSHRHRRPDDRRDRLVRGAICARRRTSC